MDKETLEKNLLSVFKSWYIRKIVNPYIKDHSGVLAIFIGGSHLLGSYRETSDLDIIWVCDSKEAIEEVVKYTHRFKYIFSPFDREYHVDQLGYWSVNKEDLLSKNITKEVLNKRGYPYHNLNGLLVHYNRVENLKNFIIYEAEDGFCEQFMEVCDLYLGKYFNELLYDARRTLLSEKNKEAKTVIMTYYRIYCYLNNIPYNKEEDCRIKSKKVVDELDISELPWYEKVREEVNKRIDIYEKTLSSIEEEQ